MFKRIEHLRLLMSASDFSDEFIAELLASCEI